ncbi:MAG TPA: alpha-ribazole phosphatase family protein [Mucilaginibacter sp.]|jgi:alpha-ribazole phosphatase|nr:alpha-ribazole phosphatase family protein [Mucilaginibacter sp.]
MEIYLVRHTEVHNPAKLCYGQSEIPLSSDWQASFDSLKNNLGDQIGDAIFYSSPFNRCTQLAGFLSNNKYIIDRRLSEMNFGSWEKCAWTAIDPDVLNLWMADYVNFRIPEGENFIDLQARCILFWDELLVQAQSEICIITHAGVIRSILANVLSIPLDKVFQLEIDCGSVTKITVNKERGIYQKVNYINYQAAGRNTKNPK